MASGYQTEVYRLVLDKSKTRNYQSIGYLKIEADAFRLSDTILKSQRVTRVDKTRVQIVE
jgi:hypothetical protein